MYFQLCFQQHYFLVTFLERHKSITVLRSLGVDKRQIFFMIVLESSTGGLRGGIFGVLIGMLLLTIVPNILAATGLVIEVEYNYFKFLTLILISTLITMIGSVSPAIKVSGLNIVETIKQE